jgi:fructose-1,6-bisphosphatase I
MATNGRERTLQTVPESLHERVPFYAGSRAMVERVHAFLHLKG